MDRDELNLPAECFKHVLFLGDELLITVWNTNIVKELIDSRVGLF
jgi:hypothetical protein